MNFTTGIACGSGEYSYESLKERNADEMSMVTGVPLSVMTGSDILIISKSPPVIPHLISKMMRWKAGILVRTCGRTLNVMGLPLKGVPDRRVSCDAMMFFFEG